MHSNIRFDFSKIPVQPKLKVSQPGDAYEQEADSIDNHIMHTSEPPSIRVCPCGGECPRCKINEEKTDKNVNSTKTIQPKLKVSQPEMLMNKKQDRVAEQVMRMSESSSTTSKIPNSEEGINRKCAVYDIQKEKKDDLHISRRQSPISHPETPYSTENEINSIYGRGFSLDNSTREFFEPRFGYDFANVRIFTDDLAAASGTNN